ncbi:hypothetical protein BGX21_010716 [Mortierella sp. AD011]|nr:hypothetical protein BGX20_010412 [Mortierella sp. AD010]KAF9393568.1 hypothetical protein BGX21_010716 [Mortierella sp. AD011]
MNKANSLVPSSTKDMRISIRVHNGAFIDVNGESIPVFYGTPECPPVISATVALETDHECVADELEILYSAVATYRAPVHPNFTPFVRSEHSFQKKRWIVDLNKPRKGRVAAGKYAKVVSATVDPLWPSSAQTVEHIQGHGWMKYEFIAKLSKFDMAKTTVLCCSQEVWVLNSVLLHDDNPSTLAQPITVQAAWKKSTLPVSLTLPSDTLSMAQVVPITVRMSPFSKGKHYGKKIVISGAYFALREKVDGRANGLSSKFTSTRNVITLPIRDGWPETAGPWERTVSLTMPTSPGVSPDSKSRYMDITHSLALVMKVKAEGEKEFLVQESEIKVPVHIVVPRNVTENNGYLLRAYLLASIDLDPTQDNLSYDLPQYQSIQ